MRYSLLFACVLCTAIAEETAARTWQVPGDSPTIQGGIDLASAGDTVLVACGVFYEHDIDMKSGIWLRSAEADPTCVTIDAQRMGRAIRCVTVDAEAGIEGFTITGGYVTGGSMPRGGAISMNTSSPTIRSCVFLENEAEAGGGAIYAYHSSPLIQDCVFARNSSIDGGGIYVSHADPVIRDCDFYQNDCMFWGGAIFVANYAAPAFTGCTIAGNRAYSGGGFWCVNECRTVFENSVIAFSTRGGGLVAEPNSGHESTVTISCSDVFGNEGGNYGGTLTDQTGIDGNISVDPLFCDLESGDLDLTYGSPCLPDGNDCGVQMGAHGAGCYAPGDATDGGLNARSTRLDLRPNPASGNAEILFQVATRTAVGLRIFDVTGRMVRELATERVYTSGLHQAVWDGVDSAGRLAGSGVYFVRLDAGRMCKTQVLVLAR